MPALGKFGKHDADGSHQHSYGDFGRIQVTPVRLNMLDSHLREFLPSVDSRSGQHDENRQAGGQQSTTPGGHKPMQLNHPQTVTGGSETAQNAVQPPFPRLLVSVRNLAEAREALAGRCDWLDVKEPHKGSLGMATVESIAEVANLAIAESSGVPVSAALGELMDWQASTTIPQIPSGVTHCKLGLAGAARLSDWTASWQSICTRFSESSAGEFRWIAAAYADWQRASAPKPADVLDAARDSSCAGLLVDTFVKDGSTLFDRMSLDELYRLREETRSTNMLFAVAGSLLPEHFARAISICPDVIAVRTAACRNRERNSEVSAQAVHKCKQALLRQT